MEKYAPINNACLMILAATAFTAFLVYTKTVLMPFVIALFIFMVANTLSTWMKQKWKVPFTYWARTLASRRVFGLGRTGGGVCFQLH